ncbi:MAG TPA: LPS export ABC transporter periplasmic protein LptC [Pseudolabrys sp.]|jgi:lipopolysaccharide export system protein LptC|nr:LPS export ABC transporter periplasmic protein LptC [Pseudolabrys sp.]
MDRLVAATPDFETARSYWTMRRGDSERAFHAARSHSRRVRILRLALPLATIVVLAGLLLWTWLNPLQLLLKVPDIGGDLVVSGTKITMQQPRITGFTRDARPYEFTASAAAQDLTRPDVVEMHNLQGKYQLRDSTTTELRADIGTYNSKKETLELGRNTVVTSSAGYKLLLNSASIDVRGAKMVSEDPVQVEMRQGKLEAKRMEVSDSGNVLRFDDVRMIITSPPIPGESAGQQ